ncbi:hypothetical protein NMY22_g15229 [Coprinellus aureogranulatus]|nr:hypothetical protein NMY22_g15229 [Coprinellus aureogranulatus]
MSRTECPKECRPNENDDMMDVDEGPSVAPGTTTANPTGRHPDNLPTEEKARSRGSDVAPANNDNLTVQKLQPDVPRPPNRCIKHCGPHEPTQPHTSVRCFCTQPPPAGTVAYRRYEALWPILTHYGILMPDDISPELARTLDECMSRAQHLKVFEQQQARLRSAIDQMQQVLKEVDGIVEKLQHEQSHQIERGIPEMVAPNRQRPFYAFPSNSLT